MDALLTALCTITSPVCTNEQRIQVENFISTNQLAPGFFSSLVDVLVNEQLPVPARQMAGSIIKTLLRSRWVGQGDPNALPENERQYFKTCIITAIASPTIQVRKIATSCLMMLAEKDPSIVDVIPVLCSMFKGTPVQAAGALLGLSNLMGSLNGQHALNYAMDMFNALYELCTTTDMRSLAAASVDCFKKAIFNFIIMKSANEMVNQMVKEVYLKWEPVLVRAISNFSSELQQNNSNEIEVGIIIPYMFATTYTDADAVNCLFAYNASSTLQQILQFRPKLVSNANELYLLCIKILQQLRKIPNSITSLGISNFYRMIMEIVALVYDPASPQCSNTTELLNILLPSMNFISNAHIDDPSIMEMFLSDPAYMNTNVRSTATQTLTTLLDRSLMVTDQFLSTLIMIIQNQLARILSTNNMASLQSPEAEVCIFVLERIVSGMIEDTDQDNIFGNDDDDDDGDFGDFGYGDDYDDEDNYDGYDEFNSKNKSSNNMGLNQQIMGNMSNMGKVDMPRIRENIKEFTIRLCSDVIIPALENPPISVAPLFVARCLKSVGLFCVYLSQEQAVKILRILTSAACEKSMPALIKMSATNGITDIMINCKDKVKDEIQRNVANLLIGILLMLDPDNGVELTEENLYSVLDTVNEIVVDAVKSQPMIVPNVTKVLFDLFIAQISDPFAIEQITDIFSYVANISPEIARQIRSLIFPPTYNIIREQTENFTAVSALTTLCSKLITRPTKDSLANNILKTDEVEYLLLMISVCQQNRVPDIVCGCCDIFESVLFATDVNTFNSPLLNLGNLSPIAVMSNFIISVINDPNNDYSSIESVYSLIGTFFSKYGLSFENISVTLFNYILTSLPKSYDEYKDINSGNTIQIPSVPLISCLNRICVSIGSDNFNKIIMADNSGEHLKCYLTGLVNRSLSYVDRKERLRALLALINMIKSLPEQILNAQLPLRVIGQWNLAVSNNNSNKQSSQIFANAKTYSAYKNEKNKTDTIPIIFVPFMKLAIKLMIRIVDIDIYSDRISKKYIENNAMQKLTVSEVSYITGNAGGNDEYFGELGITDTDSGVIFRKFIAQLNPDQRALISRLLDSPEEQNLFLKLTGNK